jgi:septal ring factor EnvC (AmiA/AmiB activator)
LSDSLAHKKGLQAKLFANTKALKDVETRLSAVEARAAKAEKDLAKVNQRQTKREQAIVECIDALSTSFGSEYFFLTLFLLF